MGFPVCEHSLHIACQSATDIYKHYSYSPYAVLIKNTTFLYLQCGGSVSARALHLAQSSVCVCTRKLSVHVQTGRVLLLGLVLWLWLGLGASAQLLFNLDGEDGVVGLRALVQLLQQLSALPEVRQILLEGRAAAAAAAGVGVGGGCGAVVVVIGLLGRLGGVIDVEALVLEELDDGELGQVQLGRQGVDGLLVGVQAHVLDEALQDAQSLQGDLPSAGAGLDAPPAASFVLRLGRRGGGGLARRQPGAGGGLLLLQRLLGQKGLGGVLEGQGGLVLLLWLGRLSLQWEKKGEEKGDGDVISEHLSAP